MYSREWSVPLGALVSIVDPPLTLMKIQHIKYLEKQSHCSYACIGGCKTVLFSLFIKAWIDDIFNDVMIPSNDLKISSKEWKISSNDLKISSNDLKISLIQFKGIFIYLKTSSNIWRYQQSILRYLQMIQDIFKYLNICYNGVPERRFNIYSIIWRYLQMNKRYLDMN